MRNINIENEFADNRKRKKRAVLWATISSIVLAVFVIISYLGYTIGEYLANVTTISFNDRSDVVGITEIGFRVPTAISGNDQKKYGFVADSYAVEGDGFVYWTQNSVSGQALRYIINHSGYSSNNSVLPVTSKRFIKGDPINLYSEPSSNNVYPIVEQDAVATKDDYIAFKLLLRVAKNTSDTETVGAADYGIFIGQGITFYGEDDFTKALRFGFESSLTTDIISPGRNTNGETAVGGRLDLDRNGYYDTTPEGARLDPEQPDGAKYELAYGDFLEPLEEANWGPVTTEGIPASADEELSFYHAGTSAGVRPLVSYSPAIQEYTSFAAYTVENPDSLPIALTDAKGIAEISLKIWLEGWDVLTRDNLRGKTFGANLRFTAASGESA